MFRAFAGFQGKCLRQKRHIKQMASQQLFKCNACNLTFKSMILLIHHIEGLNRNFVTLKCISCDKEFASEREKEIHESKEPSVSNTCDICNLFFSCVNMLTFHKNRFHYNKRPFACNICNVSFYTENRLYEHKSIHETEEPFICDICQASLYSIDCLSTHKQKEHNILSEQSEVKLYKCKFCIFTTSHYSYLQRHQKKEARELQMEPELKEYLETSFKVKQSKIMSCSRPIQELQKYEIKNVVVNLKNIGFKCLPYHAINFKRKMYQPIVKLRNVCGFKKLSKQPVYNIKSLGQSKNQGIISNTKNEKVDQDHTIKDTSSLSPNKSSIFINASEGINSEKYKAFYDEIKAEAIDVDENFIVNDDNSVIKDLYSKSLNKSSILKNNSEEMNSEEYKAFCDIKAEAIGVDKLDNSTVNENNSLFKEESTPHFIVDVKKEEVEQIKEEL